MNDAQVYDYFTVILQFLYIVFSDFYTISSTWNKLLKHYSTWV